MKKLRVGILFGGKSAEHEVSVRSARNVVAALDSSKYEPVLLGITKEGKWQLESKESLRLGESDTKMMSLRSGGTSISVIPESANVSGPVDVVFPILHGPFGEDGTVQGLLKILDVPFVGPSVLASAVGMDKDVAKRLWRDAGIPVAKFVVIASHQVESVSFAKIKKDLRLPMFVKPANLGSSVGVSKVRNEAEFLDALKHAFKYDSKVLVESCVEGREIECSVLGNEEPIASVPGEVIPTGEFYSYEAKYIDENGAALEIPARLSKREQKLVQETAVKAFKTIGCEGMARVDFFLKPDGGVVINEINTIPGFTNISMYPKLWEASGIPYSKLVDMLIKLAIARHRREKKLRTTV